MICFLLQFLYTLFGFYLVSIRHYPLAKCIIGWGFLLSVTDFFKILNYITFIY